MLDELFARIKWVGLMGKGMPIGLCCVCDDPLDLSDARVCKTCGNGFCWNECGQWHRGEHTCSTCMDADEGDQDDDEEDSNG